MFQKYKQEHFYRVLIVFFLPTLKSKASNKNLNTNVNMKKECFKNVFNFHKKKKILVQYPKNFKSKVN